MPEDEPMAVEAQLRQWADDLAATVPPWVQAAEQRPRVPRWAVPVLVLLPLWAAVYMLTLDPPSSTVPDPFSSGAQLYATNCAECHGVGGAGRGGNPALTGSEGAIVVFVHPAEQVAWVALGSDGSRAAGSTTYGDGSLIRVIEGGMPAWGGSLSAREVMEVVLHERSTLNDEAFDPARWSEGFDERLAAKGLPPERVAEYRAVLDDWLADPPVVPG
jgi:mono/diheme cytochrome c family protein